MKSQVVAAMVVVVVCMLMGMSHGLKCYVGSSTLNNLYETDCGSGTCMKVATTTGGSTTYLSSCAGSCTASTVGSVKTTCCSKDLCNAASTESVSRPVLICATVISGIVALLRSFQ